MTWAGSKRLIPAWAGKTAYVRHTGAHAPAHPRVGGENLANVAQSDTTMGSSPRGRGKLTTHTRPLSFRAHPRVGGENYGFLHRF